MTDMRALIASEMARSGKPVFALVSAVDPVNHAVKALIQPDDVETGWMQMPGVMAGSLRIGCLPDIGTHVTLMPIEGDQENLTVSGVLYDTVTTPPVSPATGKPAQPGEMLIMAGCGAPPQSGGTQAGTPTQNSPWWHLTATALYSGAGNAVQTMMNGSQVWSVGGCTATLSASGFVVTGGTIRSDTDVIADTISGKTHMHTNGNDGGNTGGPIA